MDVQNRCELCGASDDGTMRSRMSHLRSQHPAYARGLLFRLGAPGVFLVSMLVLAVAHAPQWTYIVALGLSFGLLFFGKVRSRVERSRSGTSPTIGARRLLREGGLPFLLIIPVVMLLLLLLSRS